MSEFTILLEGYKSSINVKYSSVEKQYIISDIYDSITQNDTIIPKQMCKFKNSAVLALIKIRLYNLFNDVNQDNILNSSIEFTVNDTLISLTIYPTYNRQNKSEHNIEKYKRYLIEEATKIAIDFLNLIDVAHEIKHYDT